MERVRRLVKDNREEEQDTVRLLRWELSSQFDILEGIEQKLQLTPRIIHLVADNIDTAPLDTIDDDQFAGIIAEDPAATVAPDVENTADLTVYPEQRTIGFPSHIDKMPGVDTSMAQH